jgi:bacteriocin biosynthesis cyclodehydratase domain-containing protein
VVIVDDFAERVADRLEAGSCDLVRATEPYEAFSSQAAAVVMPTLGEHPHAPLADDLSFDCGVPLLMSSIDDFQLTFGPVVIPGRTPCHHCHRERLAMEQLDLDRAIAAARRADAERIGFLGSHVSLTVTLLGRNLRALGSSPPDAGAILCYVFRPFTLRRWRVQSVAGCPRCGSATREAGAIARPRPAAGVAT